MNAVRALLGRAIDYAGLFPPAKLDLETTVRNYGAYRSVADSWALGRLVLPAARLCEFVHGWPEFAAEWPVSVVLGQDYGAEIADVLACGAQVEMVECRPARAEHVAELRGRVPDSVALFIEAPAACDQEEMLAAVESAGACAKIRTGGVTADAIPTAAEVASFLVACARRRVCLKATAGLHHAIRGVHRLTYEADSAEAKMHGFVNFFVAALVAFQGESGGSVRAALESEDAADFALDRAGIRWRDQRFGIEAIGEMRSRFLTGFGSCSFEEPMDELGAMGWLR